MEITYTLEEAAVIIHLSGELDHHEAKQTIVSIDRIIDMYMPLELTINMEKVSFMDSSGLAVLMNAYRKQCSADGTIRVIRVPQQPMKVLLAASLSRFMPIEPLI